MERLERVVSDPFEIVGRQDLIHHGANPEFVHLVLRGMACRYKVLPDG